ncbi:hypothetical protein [Martelella alba]|uniref:Concanavalin A-like lectin/glucanase superfamily protein n=1 Tax=Martelella alba TaxID=2590451 RepID=A0ABY2SU62_9HYPH|nr:hypothetical protein [Martelella alba]TKI08676.1 hypothetical protein FCN80_01085 [Martelella alba]
MMAKIDIHTDSVFTAGNYLTDINLHYPNDITKVPSLFANCILQADFDSGDSASLTRNRVGSSMTVVGSPALGAYGATFSDAAYVNTGIEISNYNASDMTMISIAGASTGQFPLLGVIQVASPQRSKGVRWYDATHEGSVWLNSSGSSLSTQIVPTALPSGQTEDFFSSRFILNNNNSGLIAVNTLIPRTLQSAIAQGSAAPYNVTGSIKIGGSVDGNLTTTCFIRAVLAFSRALTDAEIVSLYKLYQNYYYFKGITI